MLQLLFISSSLIVNGNVFVHLLFLRVAFRSTLHRRGRKSRYRLTSCPTQKKGGIYFLSPCVQVVRPHSYVLSSNHGAGEVMRTSLHTILRFHRRMSKPSLDEAALSSARSCDHTARHISYLDAQVLA